MVLTPKQIKAANEAVDRIEQEFINTCHEYGIEPKLPNWWKRPAITAVLGANGRRPLMAQEILEAFELACSRTALGIVQDDSTYAYSCGIMRNKALSDIEVDDD